MSDFRRKVDNTSIARSWSWRVRGHAGDDYNDFFDVLADKLLLDEVLAGEANPREFLKAMIFETCIEFKAQYYDDKIDRLNDLVKTAQEQGDY